MLRNIKGRSEAHSLRERFTSSMRGPLAYVGGKRAVANQIIAILPKHRTYAEIFAGGAQVFFAKQSAPVEVLNDLDGELIGFYRVVQRHYEELIRYMRFTIVSRRYYELLKATNPETLTDVQRAARFLYLQKTSYAGRVTKQNFRTGIVQPPGLNPERLPELIEETHHRLARVLLECLPYEKVLAKYDSAETCFFADPPYFGVKHYKFNFDPGDFLLLAERLGKIEGKFVLTLNDVPEVRDMFGPFRLCGIEMPYTAQKIAGRRFRELLITNF
jgi:DNA adenine methylase